MEGYFSLPELNPLVERVPTGHMISPTTLCMVGWASDKGNIIHTCTCTNFINGEIIHFHNHVYTCTCILFSR